MAHWSSSESGILRKKKKDDDIEKLLIFGYACKLFKDDEKALHIDQGKHLIPWMGDEKIKIDRYDCRGHLSDLSQYEASRQDYDTTRWLGLSENERKLEQLCDEERYYSLLNNEEEEEMYKEEELKRNKTNEFQYSYDVPTNPDEKEAIPTVPENDVEETYVPSPDLDVPVDIAMPQTVKEYTRIEKTAIFVSTQGPQMEILIKAKQSDNPQFSFLNQNDPLYKFYRHVLDAVKSRRYRTPSAKPDLNTSNTSTEENNDHYLHPSLVPSASSTEVPPPTIPSIPYRPSVNCAYSQLVSRIQGTPIGGTNAAPIPQNQPAVESQSVPTMPTADSVQPDMSSLTYEQQQQYYQYYVQRQYYEYYKQMAEKSGVQGDLSTHSEMQAFVQQMMYAQYLQHSQAQQQQQSNSTNPYAQIVSNLCKDMPNPPVEKPDISKEPVIYGDKKDALPASSVDQPLICNGGSIATKPTAESPKKAALSLIQNYASDSEDATSEDEQETESGFKMPDEETRVVIDKMASYVVKNGDDFERIVKSREDPRFVFLREGHEFYGYYRHKVDDEKKKVKEAESGNDAKAETKDKEVKTNAAKVKEKKVIAPVSFSIKKPKEDPPKEIKSALPVDEETDEEELDTQEDVVVPPVIPQPPTLVSSNTSKKVFRIETSTISTIKDKEKESKLDGNTVNDKVDSKDEEKEENNSDQSEVEENKSEVRMVTEISKEKVEEMKDEESEAVITKSDIFDKDDPILEMIDLTEDERIVDLVKNADIFDLAPEKEKTVKENRALQLERRKKALAFLKLKSASSESSQVPDGAKTTIPTIDLSNVHSPKKKSVCSDSSDEERRRHRKRSKTKDRDHHRSKRSRESEKSVSRKDREKNRKSRTPRVEKNYDSGVSEKEEGEMSDDTDDTKYKKSSHRKKKSHKRKRSKSKHRSKSKKKSKKKETRTVPSSSSDSETSNHS